MSIEGPPIPRLYAAGENGDIWTILYQCMSNAGAGCIVHGRIAGEEAAKLTPWDSAAAGRRRTLTSSRQDGCRSKKPVGRDVAVVGVSSPTGHVSRGPRMLASGPSSGPVARAAHREDCGSGAALVRRTDRRCAARSDAGPSDSPGSYGGLSDVVLRADRVDVAVLEDAVHAGTTKLQHAGRTPDPAASG